MEAMKKGKSLKMVKASFGHIGPFLKAKNECVNYLKVKLNDSVRERKCVNWRLTFEKVPSTSLFF